MATKYTITITKTEIDVPYTKRSWVKVVDVPDDKHEEIYQYVDSEAEKDVVTQVYEQVVDEIDLPEVIKAVNGMDS